MMKWIEKERRWIKYDLWGILERANKKKSRQKEQEFIKEYSKEHSEWVKQRRIEYLEEETSKLADQIRSIYQDNEVGFERDDSFWFRKMIMELKGITKKEKKLRNNLYEIRQLKFSNSFGQDKITDAMIERAREYPIEELIEAKNGMAHSPFREDKHPSFCVKNNFYYDFVTAEHGDVIDLYMRLHSVDFPTAVKSLQG